MIIKDDFTMRLMQIFNTSVVEIEDKKSFLQQTGENNINTRYPFLWKYQKMQNKDSFQGFMKEVFDSEIPRSQTCTREMLCKQQDCEVCIGLYGLFHDLIKDLNAKRNKMYYKYLVRLFSCFLLISSQKEIYVLGYIEFILKGGCSEKSLFECLSKYQAVNTHLVTMSQLYFIESYILS